MSRGSGKDCPVELWCNDGEVQSNWTITTTRNKYIKIGNGNRYAKWQSVCIMAGLKRRIVKNQPRVTDGPGFITAIDEIKVSRTHTRG